MSSHYSITQESVNKDVGVLLVKSAEPGDDHTSITLETFSQSDLLYRMTVSNIQDLSAVLESPVFPETSAVPPTGEEACNRFVESSEGPICLDALIAAIQTSPALDRDQDGIPNRSDRDVDGDGIPNKTDLDVDGDGIFNGEDADVDGDGARNEVDIDIDGDFLRNRWDLDMDGDGVINSLDDDADGDGRRKRKADPDDAEEPDEAEDNDCDPDDPDGSKDCPPETNATDGPPRMDDIHDEEVDQTNETPASPKPDIINDGAPEDAEADRGPARAASLPSFPDVPTDPILPDVPTDPIDFDGADDPPATDFEWLLADPLPSERRAITKDIAEVFDKSPEQAQQDVDEFLDADPEADESAALDALIGQAELAIERNPRDDNQSAGLFDWPVAPTGALEFDERGASVRRLAVAEADPGIGELVAATNQIFRRIEPAHRPVAVDVALEISRTDDDADVNASVETALDMIEIAAGDDTPIEDLAEAIPTLDAAAGDIVTNQDAIEAVWKIVSGLHRDFETSEGSTFSVLALVRTVQATAQLSDAKTVNEVTSSAQNVAAAAAARNIVEPARVVRAVEASGGDATDGIDADEAEAAAAQVEEQDNTGP